MTQKQVLIDYLKGNSQADQARARLASEGPTIVPQLLEALLEVLKALGRYAATQASSLNVENQIDLAAGRASILVETIASASAYQERQTVDRLIEGVRHANPSIRALAIMIGMQGVSDPDNTYLQAIAQCFVGDSEYLPKAAASIYLLAMTDSSDRISRAAHEIASEWISRAAIPRWKVLVQKVNHTAANEDEPTRRVLIGIGAMYREIAAT